jgi:putative DNA primase/helicase
MNYALTDSGNAERFAAQHGDKCRYVRAWRTWLVWDSKRWAHDQRGSVELLAKETVRSIDDEVRAETDADKKKALRLWANRSESRSGRQDMLALAQSELAAAPEDFDKDPWVLNCANGTVDLRTGELRQHRREDRITRLVDVPYEPGAACGVFDTFLSRVLGDNKDLISYVQKAVGYSLTGSVQEQCFFFLHGDGQNGKSTLANVLLKLFGEYGKAGAPDLLMARNTDQHPAEQADLEGSRLVICQEIAEGRSWNERTLKHLTGGDRIKARFMHKDWREFEPTHKLWVCANPKPKMREGGYATWRRVRLVPFEVTIPPEERDRALGEKLAAEMPGILRWAVEGCIRWQKEGLTPPETVADATDGYREESDHVRTFVEDRLVLGDDLQVAKASLYEAYTLWCKTNKETALGRNQLQKRLIARGLREHKGTGGARVLLGASLRQPGFGPSKAA